MNRELVHSCFLSFVYTATRLLCNSSSNLSSTSSKTTKKLQESTMEEEKKHCEWLRARHKTPLDSNLLASFFRHKAACRYYNISPRQSTKTSHQLLKSLVLKAPSSCTSTWNHKSSYENNSNNNNNHKTMTYWLIFSTLRTTTTGSRDSLSLFLSLLPFQSFFAKQHTGGTKIIIIIIKAGFKLDLFPAKKLSKLC